MVIVCSAASLSKSATAESIRLCRLATLVSSAADLVASSSVINPRFALVTPVIPRSSKSATAGEEVTAESVRAMISAATKTSSCSFAAESTLAKLKTSMRSFSSARTSADAVAIPRALRSSLSIAALPLSTVSAPEIRAFTASTTA